MKKMRSQSWSWLKKNEEPELVEKKIRCRSQLKKNEEPEPLEKK